MATKIAERKKPPVEEIARPGKGEGDLVFVSTHGTLLAQPVQKPTIFYSTPQQLSR